LLRAEGLSLGEIKRHEEAIAYYVRERFPINGSSNLRQHDVARVGVAPVLAGAKVGTVASGNVNQFIGRPVARAIAQRPILLKAKDAALDYSQV